MISNAKVADIAMTKNLKMTPFLSFIFGQSDPNKEMEARHVTSGHMIWTEQGQSPLVEFIRPLGRFLHMMFMTHSKFVYDTKDHIFRHVPGSKFRKLICIILQLIGLVQACGDGKLNQILAGDNKFVIQKILTLTLVSLSLTFHFEVMRNGRQIEDILNFTQKMTARMFQAGCEIPRAKTVKSISISLLCIYILHACLFSTGCVDGELGYSLSRGLIQGFVPACADQGARRWAVLFTSWNREQVMNYKFSREYQTNQILVILAGLAQLLLYFMVSLTWAMAFLMITTWALFCWKILHSFFAAISLPNQIRDTLQDIRKFNIITGIIDQFNQAYGWTILAAVLCCVAHLSVNLFHLFESSQTWTQRAMVAASVLAFGVLLLSSAQVNAEACKIVLVMKTRFQDEATWLHGGCSQTMQGMVLILHEVENNQLGFKGLGFFTITYSFIGTVLSLISTYSIVVMQFQLN